MKYTVDTNSKIINIESAMSSEELKGLCEQYPDYSFCGSTFNYIPYYPTTAPIQPYYNPYFGTISGDNIGTGAITGDIDIKDNNDSIEHSKFKVSDYPFSTSGTVTTHSNNIATLTTSSGTFVANHPKTFNN